MGALAPWPVQLEQWPWGSEHSLQQHRHTLLLRSMQVVLPPMLRDRALWKVLRRSPRPQANMGAERQPWLWAVPTPQTDSLKGQRERLWVLEMRQPRG